MALTSAVWLMRAFCSWEINPQANEDAQDGQEGCWAKSEGQCSSPKLRASVLGVPHPHSPTRASD